MRLLRLWCVVVGEVLNCLISFLIEILLFVVSRLRMVLSCVVCFIGDFFCCCWSFVVRL